MTTIAGITRRGFTGHEHLDSVGLIHMNGRVYDPAAGRFLGSDPVRIVGLSQDANPYSYAWNNPLGVLDRNGFCEDPTTGEQIPCPLDPVDVYGDPWDECDWGEAWMAGWGEFCRDRDPYWDHDPFADFDDQNEEAGSGGSGNDEAGESQGEPRGEQCSDVAGALVDFTGGDSNQSFIDDVANNFVDTKATSIADLIAGTPGLLDFGVSSTVEAGLMVGGGGVVAGAWGGVTPIQAGLAAVETYRSAVRIPGLIGFRTPAGLLFTSGVTWATNALLIKGVYNSGVLVGSVLRTTANRAAAATCGN